ncbi:MAG: transcription antitermination factor NusB [Pseudomonadota bacterium]
MSAKGSQPRRAARSLAFQILYSLGFSPAANVRQLEEAYISSPDMADKAQTPKAEGFAWELIAGIWAQQKALDEVIGQHSQHWRLDRIGRIELTILRIAVFEMLYRPDVPTKVAINEALELSKQFGDENARSFINGILDAIAKALESGKLEVRG